MSDFDRIVGKLVERRDGQRKWLEENHPEVADDQHHLDEGSPERAYWHAGSMSALTDAIELLRCVPSAGPGEG